MTPFEHLLAATEQRIATAKAAVSCGKPDDVSDLGTLIQDLCHDAVETRSAGVFDRMVGLLGRLGELEAATKQQLRGEIPASGAPKPSFPSTAATGRAGAAAITA